MKNKTGGCDLILSTTAPQKDRLDEICTISNSAYIRYEHHLYYINKSKNRCIVILPRNTDTIIVFDKKLKTNALSDGSPKKLTSRQINLIEEITSCFAHREELLSDPSSRTLHWCRIEFSLKEYTNAPEDICRLAYTYSKAQTQILLEKAEIALLLFFAKVPLPDNTESFISLTPQEVTNVRNNAGKGYNTRIVMRDFEANIFDLWVRKSDAEILLIRNAEAYTPLKQIADEVTNMFWIDFDDDAPPKSDVIKNYIEDKHSISGKEADAIDKICRPPRFKNGKKR